MRTAKSFRIDPQTEGTSYHRHSSIMQDQHTIRVSEALPGFVEYMSSERRFSPTTIEKYDYNILVFLREVGNLSIADIGLQHFISLKARLAERGAREARIASVIAALKALLSYGRDILELPVMDLSSVKLPRPPRRAVVYLTNEELERFIEAIPLRTWQGKPRFAGYRFRALVETLAATAVRLSEALSLNRDSINLERREAVIVGKGNKQRPIFFTDRALQWITRYLDLRSDKNPALFATEEGMRLTPKAVQTVFKRHRKWANLEKPVTPHVIRHTTATNLLQNGCPIGFIKEILGHERLETTCRFYLGVLNKADTQKAHAAYLNFEVNRPPQLHN